MLETGTRAGTDGAIPLTPVAVSDGEGGSGPAPDVLPRWVRNTGWSLLGGQLVAMLVYSTVEYHRFALTEDFASYSQAWWAIAHGNLDPYIAGLGVPFWKNNAEFAMWPLALLFRVDPHPIILLWVQDVVAVLTEVVAFAWIRKAVAGAGGRIPKGVGYVLALGAAVVLVADPWVYETIAFDFHFEPIAALFTVLVAYDLWSGRTRRMWWWVPLALVSTGVAALFLIGVGLSGILAGRKTRGPGASIAAVGAAWFLVFSALGGLGDGGKQFRASYGYLAGRHLGRIGPLDVIVGAFGHPGAAVHLAATHWAVISSFLVVFGVIGLLSPWGIGMAFVVLVPNLLDGSGIFVRYGASFQSWPAMPFILVGSVMVLIHLFERGEVARKVAAVVMALWAGFVVMFAVVALPGLPRAWLGVSPSAAAELARIEPLVPPNAEVVVSVPVMGRFAERSSFYAFIENHQTVPVDRRVVVFVFSPYEAAYQTNLTGKGATDATRYVESRLDARVLGSGAGVYAFAWSSPPGTHSVILP